MIALFFGVWLIVVLSRRYGEDVLLLGVAVAVIEFTAWEELLSDGVYMPW